MSISIPGRKLTDDMKRRIAVTVFAIIAYHIISVVPLPGISLANFSSLTHSALSLQAINRVSITAIGLTAWLSALTLAEFIALLAPATWTKPFTTPTGHANPFAWPVLALTMLFAGLQANGIATAISTLPDLVPEAGTVFNLTTVATLIGGTALAVVLARLIETDGVGWGFWVLLTSVIIANAVPSIQATINGLMTNSNDLSEILVAFAILVACICAVTTIILARRNMGFKSGEPLVWPMQIYSLLLGNVIVPLGYLFGKGTDAGPDAFKALLASHPLGAVISAVLLTAIVYRNAQREGSFTLAAPTAAIFISISLITAYAYASGSRLALSANHIFLIATVAALIILMIENQSDNAETSP